MIPHNTILDTAKTVINGDRRDAYGDVRSSFEKIAVVWSAILGVRVTPMQVGLCMIGLKLLREANAHKDDNLIDVVGYAALAADLVSEP